MRRRTLLLSPAAALTWSTAAAQSPREVSSQLRALALNTTPESLRLDPVSFQTQAYGAVVDVSRNDGESMTIVCFAEGSTSVYFSSGGGLVGLGSDPKVRSACRGLLAAVTERLKDAKPEVATELPTAGNVTVHGLFASGRRRITDREQSLAIGTSPYYETYKHARAVLSAVQTAQAAGRQR